MQRLTAYISGHVQKSGYRAKVIDIAKSLGIRGYVKNLADGRVKVIAEGEDSDLEEFARALMIKNTLIDVTGVDVNYSAPSGEYDDFEKIVGEGETDSRLDSAVDQLKVLIELNRAGLNKQDQMVGLMGQMIEQQDQMLSKQDELIGKMDETKNEIVDEIRQLRSDLKPTIEDRLSRIEGDVAQIKAKIGL
jgi:acylphosphatase